MVPFGRNLDQVDPGGVSQPAQIILTLPGRPSEPLTDAETARVQNKPLTCFRILQIEKSDRGQVLLARVYHVNRNQVMPTGGLLEGTVDESRPERRPCRWVG